MRLHCDRCGTRQDEWDGTRADEPPYIGDFYVCPGCVALEEEQDNVGDKAKGVHFRLLPRDVALAKMDQDKSTVVTMRDEDDGVGDA